MSSGELLILVAKGNENVNVRNLKIFLCAILNFDYPWMKVSEGSEHEIEEEDENQSKVPKRGRKVNPESIGHLT